MHAGGNFKSLFLEHQDAVFRFAWRMTGSVEAAEDVTQDCFVTLMHLPERYDRERGPMRAFLIGVARNLVRKRWRRERAWEDVEEDSLVAAPLDLSRMETSECVARAVAALPPLQCEALVLAEYEEMTIQEIADAVQAETGTVKARLHRARENLRRMLAPAWSESCRK
ncbi:MAG: RNA polymerase sigma factor [Acidobacteria bacterium]|nr:RNA polymerase sigma factor [Acidobacteriota bacterium]